MATAPQTDWSQFTPVVPAPAAPSGFVDMSALVTPSAGGFVDMSALVHPTAVPPTPGNVDWSQFTPVQAPSAQANTPSGTLGPVSDFLHVLKAHVDNDALQLREAVGHIPVVGPSIVSTLDNVDSLAHGGESSVEGLTSDIKSQTGMESSAQQAANQKPWDSLGPNSALRDWRSYAGAAANMAPEAVAMMAPPARLARGVYDASLLAIKGSEAFATMVTSAGEEAAMQAASKAAAMGAAKVASAAGVAIATGVGGVQTGAQNTANILAITPEQAKNSTAIQSMMSTGLTFDQAKDKIANDEYAKAFVLGGVATGAFAGIGDAFLAHAITGGIAGGLAKRVALGATVQAGMGAGWGASGQIAQNVAMQDVLPSTSTFEGVPNAMVSGAALGALQGGLQSGIFGHSSDASPKEFADRLDQTIKHATFDTSNPPDVDMGRDTYQPITDDQHAANQADLERVAATLPGYSPKTSDGSTPVGADGTPISGDTPRVGDLPVQAVKPQDLPTETDDPTALTRDQFEVAQAINTALGIKNTIIFHDDGTMPADGFAAQSTVPDTAFISDHSSYDPQEVSQHEVGHLMPPQMKAATLQVISDGLTPEGEAAARARFDADPTNPMPRPDLLDEIHSDIMGVAQRDPVFQGKVLDALTAQVGATQAKTYAQQFVASIADLYKRVLNVVRAKTFSTPDARSIADVYVNNIKDVHDAMAAAVADKFVTEGYHPPGSDTNASQVLVQRALDYNAAKRVNDNLPPFQQTVLKNAPPEVPPGASADLQTAVGAALKDPFNRTPEERLALNGVLAGTRMSPKDVAIAQEKAKLEEKRAPQLLSRDVAIAQERAKLGEKRAPQFSPRDVALAQERAKIEATRILPKAAIQTPEFKKWFGGSKVVDTQGNPLVVYHGEYQDIKAPNGRFWATSSPLVADTYSAARSADSERAAPYTIPAHLRLRNPMVIDADGLDWDEIPFRGRKVSTEDIADVAQKEGHDGVVFRNIFDQSDMDKFVGLADSYVAFHPNAVKSVFNDKPTNRASLSYSPKAVTQTPEFKSWFGDSKLKDAQGNPDVWYHGTARDISTFKPKQADSIFLTKDPKFAEGFASQSKWWMQNHYQEFIKPEDWDGIISRAKDIVTGYGDKPGQTKLAHQDLDTTPYRDAPRNGVAQDAFYQAIEEKLPSSEHLIPAYVKAEKPFDFEDPKQVARLVEFAKAKGVALDAKDIQQLHDGNWATIEHPAIQQLLKQSGHDGFYAAENGYKNLGVYDSRQVKSAIGNTGAFDANNPDITMSPKAPEKANTKYTPEQVEKQTFTEREALLKKTGGVLPAWLPTGKSQGTAATDEYVRRNGEYAFGTEKQAAGYARALELGEGGEWEAAQVGQRWRAKRVDAPEQKATNTQSQADLAARTDLPAGEMPGDMWQKRLPEADLSHLDPNRMYYKDEIIKKPKFSPKAPDTPEFKKWFGDSKVVDKDGKPLVVYHGTGSDIREFERQEDGRHVSSGLGFFFTEHPRAAELFAPGDSLTDGTFVADEGANIVPVHLAIKNPVVMSWSTFDREFIKAADVDDWAVADKVSDFVASAVSDGHDGILIRRKRGAERETEPGENTWVAFEPNQIKSVFNDKPTGNPDISLSPKAKPEWVDKMDPKTQEFLRKAGAWAPTTSLQDKIDAARDQAGLKILQATLDQFASVKAKVSEGAYKLLRMAGASDAGLDAAIEFGHIRLNSAGALETVKGTKSFLDIMRPLKGEAERFFAWMAANRALQLSKEQRENLFGDADINAGLKLNKVLHAGDAFPGGGDRTAVYAQALKEYTAFNKSILDIAQKSGLINAETRAIWEKQFYVPFFRNAEEGGQKNYGNVSGMVNQYASKRLTGGTGVLKDLLANTLENWSHLLSASLKNNAAATTLEQAEKLGIATPVKAIREDLKESKYVPPELGEKNAVYVMKDGKRVGYTVEDPLVLASLSALDATPFQGPVMRALGWFKHILTVGTTLSPVFRLRHTIREQITALAANPTSYNFVSNWMDGFKYSSRDNPEYGRSLSGGAYFRMGMSLHDQDAAYTKRLIAESIDPDSLVTDPNMLKQKLKQGWDWWKETGERSDSITRANLYRQTYASEMAAHRDADRAHFEASYVARDAMDYGLRGTSSTLRMITQVVPFMNARLQGLYKLGRGAAADPRRFAAVIGGVTLTTIGLSLAYRNDKDWQQRSEWDRNNNWWAKVGNVAIRIPKPFEVGAIATVADRALETALNGFDPESRERFAQNLLAVVTSQLSLNPIPQALFPMAEVWANKDVFTGRQIESLRDEKLSPSQRIGPSTSATAQILGKNNVISPKQIDFLVNAYLGWVGAHAVATADLALRPATGMANQPARRIDDYFLLGDFVKQMPSNQSRFVEQFYNHLQTTQQAFGDMRQFAQTGRGAEAAQAMKNPDAQLAPMYLSDSRTISQINNAIRLLQYRSMDPDAKRAQLDQLEQTRNRIAEQAETVRNQRLAQ